MSTDDIEEIALNSLHTNLIGEHIAHEWGVGRVLAWQPSISSDKSMNDVEALRSAGLYKVQGETVQAIMGAVYNQYVRIGFCYTIYEGSFVFCDAGWIRCT